MTDIKNADTPANPTHYSNFTNAHGGIDEFYSDNEGLTKREAFAMAAMQGLLSTEQGCNQRNMIIAERAVEVADALLKELS